MSDHSQTHSHDSHGTMKTLMTGFVLAAILTIIPFGLVMAEVEISKTTLVAIIMGLGAVQIIVHLVYFLHMNSSQEEGWTMTAAMFALIILLIVLAGSMWVMHNMNENMMPVSQQMLQDGEAGGITPDAAPAATE